MAQEKIIDAGSLNPTIFEEADALLAIDGNGGIKSILGKDFKVGVLRNVSSLNGISRIGIFRIEGAVPDQPGPANYTNNHIINLSELQIFISRRGESIYFRTSYDAAWRQWRMINTTAIGGGNLLVCNKLQNLAFAPVPKAASAKRPHRRPLPQRSRILSNLILN